MASVSLAIEPGLVRIVVQLIPSDQQWLVLDALSIGGNLELCRIAWPSGVLIVLQKTSVLQVCVASVMMKSTHLRLLHVTIAGKAETLQYKGSYVQTAIARRRFTYVTNVAAWCLGAVSLCAALAGRHLDSYALHVASPWDSTT